MSLSVASYPDPQNPASPISNAYAWVGSMAIDYTTGAGRLMILVHRSATAASTAPLPPPADQFGVNLGETLVPAQGNTPAVTFPTLPQLVAAAAAAQRATPSLDPFGALHAAIYAGLINHPKLAGATQVP